MIATWYGSTGASCSAGVPASSDPAWKPPAEQVTFFSDADYVVYRDRMAECCAKRGAVIWAWCLMPNHVHLVVVPQTAEAAAQGKKHRGTG